MLAAATSPAAFGTKVIVGIIGIAAIVLGIIFLVQAKRVNASNAAGILTIVAGAFAWILLYVSLVLWIISAVFFLIMKVKEPDETNNDSLIS